MPDMNKRLAFLEQAVNSGTADSFAIYALAMEYRKSARIGDSLATFVKLREKDAGYVAMYLMAGQMLTEAERKPEAREWLETGMRVARERGDTKALGELESALAEAAD